MNGDGWLVNGEAFTTPQMRFTMDNGTRTVLTIHRDGRLEFAPHAHPEEVVKILLDVWRKYVPQTDSERETLYSALDNMARKLTEAESTVEQLRHRLIAQYDAIVAAVEEALRGQQWYGNRPELKIENEIRQNIKFRIDASIAQHDPRKGAE